MKLISAVQTGIVHGDLGFSWLCLLTHKGNDSSSAHWNVLLSHGLLLLVLTGWGCGTQTQFEVHGSLG